MTTDDNQPTTHNPTHQASFGVGCWDFGVRCQPSSQFSVSQYVALLTRGLETVSSLNDLQIVRDPRVDSDTSLDPASATEVEDERAIFSRGITSGIRFNLYVPFRIQNELAGDRTQFHTNTEHFRVHVRHAYHSPVVFVELLDADKPRRPAAAMVVLRKYLEKECRDSSKGLAFRFLGPTPFHAHFHLVAFPAQNRGGQTFEIADVKSSGYADVTFSYCTSSFDTVQDALEGLFRELMRELGLFYRIVENDVGEYTSWSEIEHLVSCLVSRKERTSWLDRIRHAHGRSRGLEELSIALMEFEVSQIMNESYTRQSFRDVYKRDAPALLKAYVEAEIEQGFTFPTEPVTQLLTFMESRRSKTLELLVLLGAAVVGGITGSLITTLASQ